jgi:hypothetical protein
VVDGETAGKQIERLVGEPQGFGRGRDRVDIAKAAADSLGCHRRGHLGGEIAGDYLAGMRGEGVGNMPPAAPEIKRPAGRVSRRHFGDPAQIRSLGMNRAGDVVRSGNAELFTDQTVVRGHHEILLFPGVPQ